jgi:DNA-binding FadR family transcriptional regulator
METTAMQARKATATQIADSLERQIRTGLYLTGEKLPSLREVARLGGHGKNSVVSAFELLIARGLVEPRRGTGFFVRNVERQPPIQAPIEPVQKAMNTIWLLHKQMATIPGQLLVGDAFPPAAWLSEARIEQYHH